MLNPALRRSSDWIDSRLASVYRECEDAVLHRLDLAFAAFFSRCKRGQAAGFPRFKPAARWSQLEFPHGKRALRFDEAQRRLTVPGVGAVKQRKGRAVPAFCRAWIVVRNGAWYACFECERMPTLLSPNQTIIGVDRGVHVLAALSDGTLIRNLGVGERRRAAAVRLQRELERVTQRARDARVCNRCDPKRLAAAKRLARAKEREANARRDYAHKKAREIVDGVGVIALEKLNLRAMAQCIGHHRVPGPECGG